MIAAIEDLQARQAREAAELAQWRQIGGEIDPMLCACLAAYGDHASPDLISVQHRLVTLLRSPANN